MPTTLSISCPKRVRAALSSSRMPLADQKRTYVPILTTHLLSLSPSVSDLLSSTQIALTKVFKYDDPNLWAPEPGPLKLVAINTGAGRLPLNSEDGGVVIAEIQADLSGHGVSVQSHESLDIYQSTKSIQIAGSGFVDNIKASEENPCCLRCAVSCEVLIGSVSADPWFLFLQEGGRYVYMQRRQHEVGQALFRFVCCAVMFCPVGQDRFVSTRALGSNPTLALPHVSCVFCLFGVGVLLCLRFCRCDSRTHFAEEGRTSPSPTCSPTR